MGEARTDEPKPSQRGSSDLAFARRVLIGSTIALGLLATFVAVVYAASIVAALFVAVLLALGLRGLGEWIAARTGVGRAVAMIAVLLALAGGAVGFGFAVAPPLTRQVQQMSEELPRRVEEAERQLRESAVLGGLIGRQEPRPAPPPPQPQPPAPQPQPQPSAGQPPPPSAPSGGLGFAESGLAGQLLGRATSSGGLLSAVVRVASGAVAAVAAVALVVVVALYLAFRPKPYVEGFVGLLPPRSRPRAEALLGEMAHALRWWLLGQVVAMALIGTLTGIGLWIVGIELALALAIVAGLLNFVPNFGPVLSLVPALLFANGHTVEVLIVFGIAQFLESYVVTPNVQRAAVHLEPVVLIAVQVLLGALFGVPGLLVAAPLLVVVDVLVRRLWREDALRDPTVADRGPGPRPAPA